MDKRRTRLILAGFMVAFMIISVQTHGATLERGAELEAFFDGVFSIQLPAHNVPGAEIAVIKADEIIFSKGYGFSDLETQTPMLPGTTLHRPGSNSKILVWTAIMQLMEEGRLDLYTDINTYLDFTIPAETASGKKLSPITLHHLMTHTAGFEDEIAFVMVSKAEQMKSLRDYVQEHLPSRVFSPGFVMAYSNYGTTLAAYIAELVSGQPFSEYVQEHILEPLEMSSTTFAQPIPEHLATRLSRGYRYEANQFIPGGFEYLQSYPAGGLTSTTLDMARLILAQLNLGLVEPETASLAEAQENEEGLEELEVATETRLPRRILQEETAIMMQKQQFAGHPEIPGMTYGFIETNYNGHRVLSHGGDTLLFSTGLYFLPEQNVGLYVVYNSGAGGLARNSLFEAFMDQYFPLVDSRQVTPRPITAGTEENYTGVYHSSRANFTGIESLLRILQTVKVNVDAEGYLVVSSSDWTNQYGEIAPGVFQELNGQDQIAFSFEGGKAELIHVQGPGTFLRTPWHQSSRFLGSLLGIAVLFMLATILGWIRTLFQTRQKRRPFTLPKLIAVLFILLFFTIGILIVDLVSTTHPTLGIPLLVLEPSATLKAILLLTKVLMGLGVLMLATSLYVMVTKKGTAWQKLHFALLTLSSLSVILVLWQMNFL